MTPTVTVGEAVALLNQTLEYAYPSIEVVGEVSSFKVNQSKYVFFDIKDTEAALRCFMMKYQLRVALEDGMKVKIVGRPRVTAKGAFSITVDTIVPMGAGSIKRSFDLLRAKLEKEGLFSDDRKRSIPDEPQRLAIVGSTQSAGYTDFVALISQRWGAVAIDVAHVQVQGDVAADQIMRAMAHFNQSSMQYDALVLLRGGGSADDLAVFNDEQLVRAVASSKIPVVSAIGHEQDVVLTDFSCDVRASTPSHAAQLLVPDKHAVVDSMHRRVVHVAEKVLYDIRVYQQDIRNYQMNALDAMQYRHSQLREKLRSYQQVARTVDPQRILAQGYAIVRGTIAKGQGISVLLKDKVIEAEVKNVTKPNEY